jgi:hypothetical protein
MNCSAEIPMIGDNITCPITITKYGSPVFAYFTMLDFGDGVVQNLTIKNTDSVQQTFVVNFVHQYQNKGVYSARISIPALKIDKVLMENVHIYGKYILSFVKQKQNINHSFLKFKIVFF